jgi:poly-gamma-glutamate capsule biosynthesis protein CapA/YwtB (metallophosphatase superfamily)
MMYFVNIAITGGAVSNIEMIPLSIKQLRLVPASKADVEWIRQKLDSESRKFATTVTMSDPGHLIANPAVTHEIDSHQ